MVANTKVLRKSYETKCLKFYIVTSFSGGRGVLKLDKRLPVFYFLGKKISVQLGKTWFL